MPQAACQHAGVDCQLSILTADFSNTSAIVHIYFICHMTIFLEVGVDICCDHHNHSCMIAGIFIV